MPERNLAFVTSETPVKQRLLELAIQTIDESGEPGIRVNQLAESAGVSIPTLYHHFGSREGLIEEAQAERFIRALRDDAVLGKNLVQISESAVDLAEWDRTFDEATLAVLFGDTPS
jgi:AcrR family transcriptional regulator